LLNVATPLAIRIGLLEAFARYFSFGYDLQRLQKLDDGILVILVEISECRSGMLRFAVMCRRSIWIALHQFQWKMDA
jgi:hypothetical protein